MRTSSRNLKFLAKGKIFVALALGVSIACRVLAGTSSASADRSGLLDELRKSYGDSKTLVARFTQKRKNILGEVKESSGTIEVKRPNKFRWETFAPEKSLLVANAKRVWYYTPPFRSGEKGQLMIRKSTDVQSQVAIDLLAGSADLKKAFHAQRLGEQHYELKPIKSAGDISKIELFLERSTKLVYKIVLTHSTGNETELALQNVKLGTRLDDSRFEFKAPPGTEEIR
ncbi:MAG: outer membrane lipoprotein chaperone LolA [Deltaproteobacteria bacterium]|nr:outer membrane lipoprotein chaperone LolA [Deltaproteobacteria bacterium]